MVCVILGINEGMLRVDYKRGSSPLEGIKADEVGRKDVGVGHITSMTRRKKKNININTK